MGSVNMLPKIQKNMKLLSLIFLSFISICCNAKGIKCIYVTQHVIPEKIYMLENKFVREKVIADLKEDKKFYSLTCANGKYLFERLPGGVDKVPLSPEQTSVFINFTDSSKIVQQQYAGQYYILNTKAENYSWNITNETKRMSGWHCIKAELKNDPKIIAWFTLDIPLSYGPWGYYGLPGLIVQMQTPVYILHLNEVTSTDGIELNPPSTGEAISQKDFDKLVGKSDKERFKSADKVTYH